jgi:dihydrofolate reductase
MTRINVQISLIAAIAENRALGKDNRLLWHIPADLQRFKKITTGHPVIMGRKTYESIGKPLPGRVNIIVTRDNNYQAPGCLVVHSLQEAIKQAANCLSNHDIAGRSDGEGSQPNKPEIFIIGGGQLYQQAISLADKLYLTIVKGDFAADTFFPDYQQFKKVVWSQKGQHDHLSFNFLELTKG